MSLVEAGEAKLLHLGCGLIAPPQWTNVDGSSNAWLAQRPLLRKVVAALRLAPQQQLDIPWPQNIIVADLRKRLPFPDGSFDAVFSSHLVEHLDRDAALALLREAHRLLRPGGICRTLVPDLRSIVREYLGEMSLDYGYGSAARPDDPAHRMCQRLLMRPAPLKHRGLLYRIFAAGADFHSHKWMYDGPSLVRLMAQAGFMQCRERGFRESDIPHLDQVETEARVLNGSGVIAEGLKQA